MQKRFLVDTLAVRALGKILPGHKEEINFLRIELGGCELRILVEGRLVRLVLERLDELEERIHRGEGASEFLGRGRRLRRGVVEALSRNWRR